MKCGNYEPMQMEGGFGCYCLELSSGSVPLFPEWVGVLVVVVVVFFFFPVLIFETPPFYKVHVFCSKVPRRR